MIGWIEKHWGIFGGIICGLLIFSLIFHPDTYKDKIEQAIQTEGASIDIVTDFDNDRNISFGTWYGIKADNTLTCHRRGEKMIYQYHAEEGTYQTVSDMVLHGNVRACTNTEMAIRISLPNNIYYITNTDNTEEILEIFEHISENEELEEE